MCHKAIFLKSVLLILIFSVFGVAEDSSIYLSKVVIPVGKENDHVRWIKFGNSDWRVSIKSFLIGNLGRIYFREPLGDKIKVFDHSGKFLGAYTDYNTYSLFLYRSRFYGIRKSQENDREELVVFNESDGALIYRKDLPFQGPLWTAYALENGKLFISSKGIGIGEIRFYDIEKQIFSAYGELKQYDDDTLNYINSACLALGYEKIGRLSDFLLFRHIKCKGDDSPCLYYVVAAKMEKGKIHEFKIPLREDDIGYYMPDVAWILSEDRYLYAIGYPRKGTRPGDKIIVTRIDLQKALPEVYVTQKGNVHH